MKITEHEMRGLLTGKCIPGDMKVNEELPTYLLRKFVVLHEQVQALAAENAAMKRDLRVIANSEPFEGDTAVCDFDSLVSVAAGALVTPATEAALRGLQAQELDCAADELMLADTVASTGVVAHLLRQRAARLRTGEVINA
ncbi:hypothetical protein [Serratia proteamaculans]